MARALQFSLFLTVILSFATLVHLYLVRRLARDPGLPARARRVVTVVIVLLGVSLPLAMLLGRVLPFGSLRLLQQPAYVWMGTMCLLAAALLLTDLGRALLWLGERVGARLGRRLPPFPSRAQSVGVRRAAALVALLVGLGGTAYGVVHAVGGPVVVRIEVPLPGLPARLDGLRLVQLSDLHVGGGLGGARLARIVAQVQARQPDLIAITGDLVDGAPEQLLPELEPLRRLQAPLGVYFVTGNHEYYSGVERWIPEFERLGLRVLRNEAVALPPDAPGFTLFGIDDSHARSLATGHGADLHGALAGATPGLPQVLLTHQPAAALQAAQHGVGLVLAGHTHGGQLWPFTLFVRLQQPFLAGLYTLGDTRLWVSQGTGWWGPPLRLGTDSELTEIVLRAR